MVDVSACRVIAEEAARLAGQVIRDAFQRDKRVVQKSSAIDLLTETDTQVEALLVEKLKAAFPDHQFIGEESVSAGQKCELTNSPTWIIDPVDGTMNFVHSFPQVAVSIALWVEKRAELAIVYSAILDQMYIAERGKGAFCNGSRLNVSATNELSQALVLCEVGSSHDQEKLDCLITNFSTLVARVHSLRSMGSAALNMCYVASGAADAYYEYGLHCWDMAAAALIIEEAGGVVVDTEGGPLDIMNRRMVCASTDKLAKELSASLKHITLERD